MSLLLQNIENGLAQLDRQSLQRTRRIIDSPCGTEIRIAGRPETLLNFAANDYLGLANDPQLIEAACEAARRWGVGSGASHLVSGHLAPHEQLECRLAAFVGMARALTFSTGYLANLAVTPALVGRGDLIFHDRLNHASLIDAVKISGAEHKRYAHNDVAALARLLEQQRHASGTRLILTDAVFSMDGDLAPLGDIVELAEQHDAWLVVDDAHGFGVLGPQGRGSLAHLGLSASPRLILMGTLGKAAGVSGAFVAGDARVIEWLLQKARTYIFTTAASPITAATLLSSLSIIEQADDRRDRLARHIQTLRNGLAPLCQKHGWQLLPSDTAIQPLVIGDNAAALQLAQRLYERGIFVPAIRPPTVPVGQARLRITLSAAMEDRHIERLIEVLTEQ